MSPRRICRRYKICFLICFFVFAVQVFLGCRVFVLQREQSTQEVEEAVKQIITSSAIVNKRLPVEKVTTKEILPAIPVQAEVFCKVAKSKEALSAIGRAKTNACKEEITRISCLNEHNTLYPLKLPRLCNLTSKHPFGKFLGCYKDNQKDRDLASTNIQLAKTNEPSVCINYCLNGGYQYAGVQYKDECWCGNSFGKYGSLPVTSCNTVCPGNQSETCGGYNAQRIFSTGLNGKKLNAGKLINSHNEVASLTSVRIVFVLTVNGRAVRQVRRLINILYDPQHYFYIHVDSRSEYMYRELFALEKLLPNVRLARQRFATIWGGASLLQAHLYFIEALLNMTDWKWDYYVNLSESDYPIKPVDNLTWFLTSLRGNNFLRSNGRETFVFIKKQGLSQLFHECDKHLWRLGKCPLQEGIMFDGGSDWLGLHRSFCEYSVKSQDALVTGLKQFYKYTLLPVESFFHTLLYNSAFCGKLVDNNLHLTNWKRKQGCKCQHKDQVDWCGCSPNVFKVEDLDRLLNYKAKPVYFARKFEPIINQEIINNIDMLFGRDLTDYAGLIHYWHNDFHYLDSRQKHTDLWLSFMLSLLRRTQNIMASTHPQCLLRKSHIIESHVLNVADNFYRYLVKYNATIPGKSTPVMFESQYSFRSHVEILRPEGPIGRLQTLEVGSNFDLKELIFRNYPKFLGAESDVRLRHVWRYGNEFTMAIAWVDPAGVIAAYQDVSIGSGSQTESHNPKLKTPLRPGVWTVKIIHLLRVCAQVQFVVLPFSVYNGAALTPKLALDLHNGPDDLYSHTDFSEFTEQFGVINKTALAQKAELNGKKVKEDLNSWIDSLTMEFWSVQDACVTEVLPEGCPPLDLCKETRWSSMSPDPKTEFSTNVMKHSLKK